MRQKDLISLITILTINLLTCFVLLPYAQKTANSHMNIGPFAGTIYFILAGLVIVVFMSKRNFSMKLILGVVLLATTCIYWGVRLHSLHCVSCATV